MFGACGAEQTATGLCLEQPVEQERRVRGLRRDARDAGDVDVPALLARHERPVGIDRLARLVEADGQALLHLVAKQRGVAGRPSSSADDRSGRRSDPELRDRPQNLHLEPSDTLARLRLIKRDPRRISRPLRALEVVALIDDDPVVADGAAVRQLVGQTNEVVELDDRVVVQADDEAVCRGRDRSINKAKHRRVGQRVVGDG